MKKFIVDVQGFKGALNEFIFKEVVILRLNEDSMPTVILFEPPDPLVHAESIVNQKDRSENRHLSLNFHGLSWDRGDVPYSQLSTALHVHLDGADIYVKGLEKAEWLRHYFPKERVHDMANLGCPALHLLPLPQKVSCSHHYVRYLDVVCAVKNVYALRDWMIKHGHEEEDISHLHSMYN